MENQNTTPNNNENKKEELNNYLIPAPKKLYRSPHNAILLGVASGLAEYLNVSVVFIRILFVFTALLGGWGIIAYVVCMFLIPEHPSVKAKGKFTRLNSPKFLGFIFVVVGIYNWIPPFGVFRYFDAFNYADSLLFAVLSITFGLFVLLKGKRKEDDVPIHKPVKLYRAKSGKRLLGICEGLSNYMDTDVNIIRMVWILLSFITLGIAALFYFVIGYFIPIEKEAAVSE